MVLVLFNDNNRDSSYSFKNSENEYKQEVRISGTTT